MDSTSQFSCGDDDRDWLSEEVFSGVASSSGEDEEHSFETDSEGCEMNEEVNGNGLGVDLVPSDGDPPSCRSVEDFMDHVFNTEEEAYAAYKQFARLRGFGVRKGDVARVDGVLVRRDFFLPPGGYKVWKVRRIDDSHNHPLAATMFNHLLPSHRSLSESNKAQVDSLKKFGIATLKIMAYMAGQSGGYGMLQFTKRDLYNYVHIQRLSQINDGDAAATISYLEGKANADIMSVARYTKPLEGRLGSLFWADGQMMADYKLFGDVVAFDATYRSNKYKKPLVVFSGSNHNKQTAIFGFALLEDEEVRTYRWVLLNLVDIMDNKKPSVVVTDGDKAMRAAIDDVLPSARHRLCGWHLEKNCVMQVKEPDFRKVFKKEMYANLDVLVFEDHWTTTVQSLGLMNNSWGGEGYRNNEVTAQFYSTYYTPVLITGLDKIELFASKIYTGSVFKEVRKQIKAVGGLLFLGKDTISTTSVYKFSSTANRRSVRRVLYDPTEPKIECDCHMWNSEGIPCTHIFSVMKYEGLEEISPSLILRRWCKDAKEWTPKETEREETHGS
ncbi:protein FAR1-RELATED SEQUENCE 5-like [Arachis ipaensis]|uniref:SWIM-type domain-containing protein n=1 Tax=Arachis hypogaea TaxID=3818 RepID=A0A444YC17_ARAHY|nr:protein FAR1-RELATED SEQUENCE 5-like [Arachis ipaensis]RYQ99407.1 hypothetical protein Ahy_B07g087357 isoform C [Arachis hypogaea]